MEKLEITRPDDWHIHLREGNALATTIPHAAQQFSRVLVMPNTIPPISDVASALNYQREINKVAEQCHFQNFQPLMTLYLTDNISPATLLEAAKNPNIIGCKLYPQGATTNSAHGVTDIKKIYPLFDTMQECNLPLLIHGEVTQHDSDIFDREAIFIDQILTKIRTEFPQLKITLEHITTKEAVDFIKAHKDYTAATITPHHLLLNRNDLLVGGIRPHYYCLPILKARDHQLAIQQAALSGDSRFFAGSDSAPHAVSKKESACGCAGIYHGPHTISLYTEFFDESNALDKLEPFMSFFGADYYGLPRNEEKITLRRKPSAIPLRYAFESGQIVPMYSGQNLSWELSVIN